MFSLLLQNVLPLLFWPASVADAQSASPIADSHVVFTGHKYFHKKIQPHLNAGRYPVRIAACRT